MADGEITINCPAMLVQNTGWRARSVRRAVELPCTGHMVIGNSVTPLRNFRFPACYIRFVSLGKWMVDPVVAFGDGISIDYPAEPIHRRGNLMIAEPIQNIISNSVAVVNGVSYYVYAPLPEALADPGPMMGLFSYTVRPVTIKGLLWRK